MPKSTPKTSIDPIVARNLRIALERRGRSAYSVANALGHPSNWLYQVLGEKSGLLIPSLRKVAEELGVSIGSLVDTENIQVMDTENIQVMDKQADPNRSIAGQRLATARVKAGKSQTELAMVLGTPYNQQMISEVERGSGNLPLDRAAHGQRRDSRPECQVRYANGKATIIIAPNILICHLPFMQELPA